MQTPLKEVALRWREALWCGYLLYTQLQNDMEWHNGYVVVFHSPNETKENSSGCLQETQALPVGLTRGLVVEQR